MFQSLLVLAQESAIFNLRNGILLLLLIAIIVGYKMYKSRQQ
jgi:hypothetical protein